MPATAAVNEAMSAPAAAPPVAIVRTASTAISTIVAMTSTMLR